MNQVTTNKFIRDISNKDVDVIHGEIIRLYEYIKDKPEYRMAADVLQVHAGNYTTIKAAFPLIEYFKQKYNMSDFILFLTFTASDGEVVYEQNPHNHNTDTNGSIFFPVVYSKYARTNFYLPPEETVRLVEMPDKRYTPFKECLWHTPAESYDITKPVVFNINEFHQPVEIKKHDDNRSRVVCNWKSNVNFDELVEALDEI